MKATFMSEIKNGGSAFPMQDAQAIHAYALGAVEGVADTDERDRLYTQARSQAVGGMSLRDYFAAKAFPYQLTMEARPYEDYNYLNAAKRAYRMADAMLKARES